MPRRNFKELEAKMGPDRIASSNARLAKMIEEMPVTQQDSQRRIPRRYSKQPTSKRVTTEAKPVKPL
jgi:hypothetical protein